MFHSFHMQQESWMPDFNLSSDIAAPHLMA